MERHELRERIIAAIISAEPRPGGVHMVPARSQAEAAADAILAIPELADARKLLDVSGPLQTAHRYLLIGQPDDAYRVVDTFLAKHFKIGRYALAGIETGTAETVKQGSVPKG